MKHIEETQTADGTVTGQRWFIDGVEVTEAEFNSAAEPQAAFLAAVEAATDLAELKAALTGNPDRPAMAQARGKSGE